MVISDLIDLYINIYINNIKMLIIQKNNKWIYLNNKSYFL